MPTIDELWNLPTTAPTGAANPFTWPWLSASKQPAVPTANGGVTEWLQGNSTALVVIASALFVLALFGGKRR